MKWSWKIARVAGVNVYIHWTFLLLLAFVGFVFATQGDSWTSAAVGVGFVIAIFACVLLHEFGHALMGRQFGVPTRDITLLPIGGVARMQRMPQEPGKELAIAIAGPLVNVAIAAILAGVLFLQGGLQQAIPTTMAELAGENFLANLMWVNILLVAFNLLPAFPMDGGRVLRALLAMRLEYSQATAIAAGVGQFMAMGFGLLGLVVFNPFLIFIALFVFLGAGAEAQQAKIRMVVAGAAVEDAMLTEFRTLSPHDPLGRAADELIAGTQQHFPVADNGRYVGVLSREALVRGLGEQGRDAPIEPFVANNGFSVGRHDSLEEKMRQMQEERVAAAPVLEGETIVGMLTLENVGEFIMVRSASRKSPSPAA